MSSPIGSSGLSYTAPNYQKISYSRRVVPKTSLDESMCKVNSAVSVNKKNLTWEGKNLRIPISYLSAYYRQHEIGVSMKDTSLDGNSSYRISLLVYNYYESESKHRAYEEVIVDLSEYAISGTKFTVFVHGMNVSEVTFE